MKNSMHSLIRHMELTKIAVFLQDSNYSVCNENWDGHVTMKEKSTCMLHQRLHSQWVHTYYANVTSRRSRHCWSSCRRYWPWRQVTWIGTEVKAPRISVVKLMSPLQTCAVILLMNGLLPCSSSLSSSDPYLTPHRSKETSKWGLRENLILRLLHFYLNPMQIWGPSEQCLFA